MDISNELMISADDRHSSTERIWLDGNIASSFVPIASQQCELLSILHIALHMESQCLKFSSHVALYTMQVHSTLRLIHKIAKIILQILGSVGKPVPGTLVKVVDAETNRQVGPGIKGLVKVRGPQIMKGYYKVRIYHF